MAKGRPKEMSAFEKAIERKKQEAIRLAEEAYRRALEEASATAEKEAAADFLRGVLEGTDEVFEKPRTIGELYAIIEESGAEEAIFSLPLSYLRHGRENVAATRPTVEVTLDEVNKVKMAITGVKCTIGQIRKKTGLDVQRIHACMEKLGVHSEGARRSKVYWL